MLRLNYAQANTFQLKNACIALCGVYRIKARNDISRPILSESGSAGEACFLSNKKNYFARLSNAQIIRNVINTASAQRRKRTNPDRYIQRLSRSGKSFANK